MLVPDTFFSFRDSAVAGGVTGEKGRGGGPSTVTTTSLLVDYVREEFPGVVVEPVGRKYWNDAGGLHRLYHALRGWSYSDVSTSRSRVRHAVVR